MRFPGLFFFANLLLLGCLHSPPTGAIVPISKRLVRPIEALATRATSEELLQYEGFYVSYNKEWLIPNWVSYELTAEETSGPYSRKGKDFQADPEVHFLQADGYDYRGSGWSRGHMAPAADFKWSDKAIAETFYYTNICPQDVQLNNRYWNTLENKVRFWANLFGSIYVVTGPIVDGHNTKRIGNHGVRVPDAFFKVILASSEGRWTSIAFIMQNTPEPRQLKDCATTVNEIETLSGFDLFYFLEDSIEEQVESMLDYKTWRIY